MEAEGFRPASRTIGERKCEGREMPVIQGSTTHSHVRDVLSWSGKQ